MLIVWFFAYKKLAKFAVRGALPPRTSESPVCATDNKPSCVLNMLGWFIGSRGFSSLERRPKFRVLQTEPMMGIRIHSEDIIFGPHQHQSQSQVPKRGMSGRQS